MFKVLLYAWQELRSEKNLSVLYRLLSYVIMYTKLMKLTIFVIDCNMCSSKMLGYDIDDLIFSGSTYPATVAEALLYHIFMVIERKICDK